MLDVHKGFIILIVAWRETRGESPVLAVNPQRIHGGIFVSGKKAQSVYNRDGEAFIVKGEYASATG